MSLPLNLVCRHGVISEWCVWVCGVMSLFETLSLPLIGSIFIDHYFVITVSGLAQGTVLELCKRTSPLWRCFPQLALSVSWRFHDAVKYLLISIYFVILYKRLCMLLWQFCDDKIWTFEVRMTNNFQQNGDNSKNTCLNPKRFSYVSQHPK